jgi:hypothetical protein
LEITPMTRRGVRFSLLLLLAAVLGTAAWFIVLEESAARLERDAARQFDAIASRAQRSIGDVRAGQQAYVAAGQSLEWWRQSVQASLRAVDSDLAALRDRATDPSALNDLDAAGSAADSLADIDGRAARLAGDDQRSRASALVFGEGFEAATLAIRRIETARQAEEQASDRSTTERRRREAWAAAGAGAFALLVGLLLAPGAAPRARADTVHARDAGGPAPSTEAAAPVAAIDPAPAAPTAAARVDAVPAVPEATPGAAPFAAGQTVRDRRRAPELRAAADLCTDFARLVDGSELPALLERSARLLDATGTIVWMADAPGDELRPVLAHGYSEQALARLPAIRSDADNATAAAYRTSQVEVVRTNGMSPGAIVVPILTASGCVGVMAAEVRHGREASESARALARIIAAQLATIIAGSTLVAAVPPETHSAVG